MSKWGCAPFRNIGASLAFLTILALPTVGTATQQRFCTFATDWTSEPGCFFVEQKKEDAAQRATIVGIGRSVPTSVRLHTEPGDNNVVGSGEMERNDLYLAVPGSADPVVFTEGEEHWWSHSILFPADFADPRWHMYVVFDFHNTGNMGQANFHINFQQRADVTEFGDLIFRGYGGANFNGGEYKATIFEGGVNPPIQKSVWYDFVYHVKWSDGPGGFFDAWVRKAGDSFYRRVLNHQGPTLYSGEGVYLKLANYHVPICDPYPACIGTHSPTAVIHARVVQGTTPEDVKDPLAPLELWYEENDPSVVKGGVWVQRGSEVAVFSRGGALSSEEPNATATLNFTGRSVSWRGLKCNVCGIAAVSIDGGPETLIDTAGPAAPGSPRSASETVFTASGLAAGNHTLQIRVTGTTTSSGVHIALDRLDVH